MKNQFKNWVKKASYAFALMLVLAVIAFAATPTQTYLSDATSYFKGSVGIGESVPEATLDVYAVNTDKPVLWIENDGVQSSGTAALYVVQDAPTSSVPAMKVWNDGTGNGLTVDQNGAGVGINIDGAASGATERMLTINRDSSGATREVVQIVQNHASNDQNAVEIQQDGTGYGLYVNQVGNKSAININMPAATSYPAIRISTGDEGACSTGNYGMYTSGGDLYWCKNGVSTKLN